ncbi:hypothetical protein AVEN_182718-1 [Araneus ventricosus]|uniref:Histone-lysine N-methyltransferase SETMAR n=1 Tax=Araneus ventricosus TaxID=182803 RepID=A0A4Y2K099_ARAVE|nr:hypothetical protein AVEN_13343-1 [Araneus ventricosus]GBM95770.1 hypothetical protein AVEN_182718-1 [Araneus ventricosus]
MICSTTAEIGRALSIKSCCSLTKQEIGLNISSQLDNLKQATNQKRTELANREGVVFHMDKAKPHVSLTTRLKLLELGWDVLPRMIPTWHLQTIIRSALCKIREREKVSILWKSVNIIVVLSATRNVLFPFSLPWSKIVQCLRAGGQLKVTFSPHYGRGRL